MDEKLKRLTTKLVDLFNGEFKSPQDCFDKFAVIYKQQYEYFKNFEPSNLLKLIFYVYSYKNTGNFKLAENLLNKSSFASLFRIDSDFYETECENCNGEGDFMCDFCDGNGSYNCDDCDGDGKIQCDTCNGTGEDSEENSCEACNGDGDVDCDTCNGSGKIECPECSGEGRWNCSGCDGTGQVETDEHPFYYYFIITWNPYIKNRCELEVGTMTPALSEYDFDRLRGDYIILGYDEDHAEFRNAVEANEYYCSNYGDEPDLFRNHSSTLGFWGDDNGLDKYRM